MEKRLALALTLMFLPVLLGGRNFSRLTVDNGLSNNTVSDICQDRLGRIWMATHGGVNRYNGSDVDYFRHDRDNGLSLQSNYVSRMYTDSHGDIWACTADGISLFDPDTETFRPISIEGMAAIEEILQLSPDIYLLGTRNRSVFYNRKNGVAEVVKIDGADVAFYGSACMGDTLVLGSAGKKLLFLKWDGTKGLERILPDVATDGRIICMAPDGRNGLWLGGNRSGLLHWDRESHAVTEVHLKSLTTPRIESLACDSNGCVWVGTKKGISILDPSTGAEEHLVHNPMDESSLSSDAVRVIFRDSQNNMWVGSSYGGVCCFRARHSSFHTIKTENSPHGINESIIRTISVDEDRSVWMGTRYDGLYHYNPSDGSISTYEDMGYTLSLLIPPGNTVYAGTYSNGIYALDKKTGRQTPLSQNIDANAMALANNGCLWVASLSGLYLLNTATRKIKCVRKRESGALFRAISLLVDSRGRLWVGAKECLKLFAVGPDNSLTDISPSEFRDIVRVQNIHEDSKGNIWLGTSDGLLEYSSGQLLQMPESSGLRNEPVDGIVGDEDGLYWVITDNGLCRLDPDSGEGRFYYTEDGLPGNQYNNGAICRSDDGIIYIGGAKGLSYFVPSLVEDNTVTVPPYISSVSVNNVDMLRNGEAKLKRGQNSFRVRYACPDYASWGHNHFRYKLEGFDDDWNYSTLREARYTNIPKGRYKLRVAASNCDGIWSEEEAVVRIVILPPFYRSTAFEILLILLAVMLLCYVIWRQIRRVRKQSESKLEKMRLQYEENLRKTRLMAYVKEGTHLSPQEEDFLSSVLRHVESGVCSSSYSVENLAEEMCMSRSNLHIKMKAITDLSPIELIKQMRIEKACRYLREGQLPLKDIADKSGFSSLSYFSTAFKKSVGMTPGEYAAKSRS